MRCGKKNDGREKNARKKNEAALSIGATKLAKRRKTVKKVSDHGTRLLHSHVGDMCYRA